MMEKETKNEGAVIGIFKAEETEFTKDTALMTTTSAKDGSFSFAKSSLWQMDCKRNRAAKGICS